MAHTRLIARCPLSPSRRRVVALVVRLLRQQTAARRPSRRRACPRSCRCPRAAAAPSCGSAALLHRHALQHQAAADRAHQLRLRARRRHRRRRRLFELFALAMSASAPSARRGAAASSSASAGAPASMFLSEPPSEPSRCSMLGSSAPAPPRSAPHPAAAARRAAACSTPRSDAPRWTRARSRPHPPACPSARRPRAARCLVAAAPASESSGGAALARRIRRLVGGIGGGGAALAAARPAPARPSRRGRRRRPGSIPLPSPPALARLRSIPPTRRAAPAWRQSPPRSCSASVSTTIFAVSTSWRSFFLTPADLKSCSLVRHLLDLEAALRGPPHVHHVLEVGRHADLDDPTPLHVLDALLLLRDGRRPVLLKMPPTMEPAARTRSAGARPPPAPPRARRRSARPSRLDPPQPMVVLVSAQIQAVHAMLSRRARAPFHRNPAPPRPQKRKASALLTAPAASFATAMLLAPPHSRCS